MTLHEECSSGIFWDNDSLSALLALELKADFLILLSDVEGLHSGPPSDPQSKLIHTYVKEKHQNEITFGDKSRVGRGGMTAKVKASILFMQLKLAFLLSLPVLKAYFGYAAENIIKVLQGQRIGTLFHKDAHRWEPVKEVDAREMAVAARDCSRRLHRKQIWLKIADALEAHQKEIRIENEADVAPAQEAGYEKSLLAEGLILEKTSSPLGVLLIVFEYRPDALVQIASLAIRSGNGLLLKGGKEAKRSNAILHKVITEAIPDTVGSKLIGLVTSREEIPELLKLDDGIDLETLLVHKDLLENDWLNNNVVELRTEGITLYGGPKASPLLNIPPVRSFHHEYNSLACAVEIVDDIYAAIDHINLYGRHICSSAVGLDGNLSHFLLCGSAHTGSIVAEDHEVADVFLRQADRILKGSGQIVDGDKAVSYTHRDLAI
ncbi:hypothetical protein VNO77_43701 [Canavalia gladiata]|uniref:Aspartate/glutamate/uridylate kinase domain-containing protein n=1 Tax=Canavalia gladiata TaxID=3824 RepID=A0AAN9JWV3_CANGL